MPAQRRWPKFRACAANPFRGRAYFPRRKPCAQRPKRWPNRGYRSTVRGFLKSRPPQRCPPRPERGTGEENISLVIAPNIAGEPVVGEPLQRGRIDYFIAFQPFKLFGIEAKIGQRFQESARARHDSIPAARRETAGKDLKYRPAVGRTRAQCGLEHR